MNYKKQRRSRLIELGKVIMNSYSLEAVNPKLDKISILQGELSKYFTLKEQRQKIEIDKQQKEQNQRNLELKLKHTEQMMKNYSDRIKAELKNDLFEIKQQHSKIYQQLKNKKSISMRIDNNTIRNRLTNKLSYDQSIQKAKQKTLDMLEMTRNNRSQSQYRQNITQTKAQNKSQNSKKRERPTTRRVRKYFLAVFYLMLLVNDIRKSASKRKLKSQTLFNNFYKNVLTFMINSTIEILSDVQKRIQDHKDKSEEYLKTPQCYQQVLQINMILISKLDRLKQLLVKDSSTRKLLKLLIKQNQFIPNNYLTIFQLNRIAFSTTYGFVYKNKSTAIFLLLMLIIMRSMIYGVLTQPLKLSVQIYANTVLKKILQYVASTIYYQTLEIINGILQTSQYKKYEGNWKHLHSKLVYVPAQTMNVQENVETKKQNQQFCIVNAWPKQVVEELRKNNLWNQGKTQLIKWIDTSYYLIKDINEKSQGSLGKKTLSNKTSFRNQ